MDRCTNTLLMLVLGLGVGVAACVSPGTLDRTEFGDDLDSKSPQTAAGTTAMAGRGGAGSGVTGGAGSSAPAGMGGAGAAGSMAGGAGAAGGAAQGCLEACTIMTSRCATAGCHDASGTSAMLNLATTGVGARLTGASAKSSCVGRPLLDAATPMNGVFVAKITGNSCGTPMPVGPALSPSDLSCLQRWAASPRCTGE